MKTMTRLTIAAYKEKYRIQKQRDEKLLELLEIEHKMTGLAKSGKELTPEQQRSSKAMPHTVSPNYSDQKILSLIERKDEIQAEIDYLDMSLRTAAKIERMPLTDQQMMHDLYHSRMTAEDVADKYGYHPKSMYRHIYGVLDMLL